MLVKPLFTRFKAHRLASIQDSPPAQNICGRPFIFLGAFHAPRELRHWHRHISSPAYSYSTPEPPYSYALMISTCFNFSGNTLLPHIPCTTVITDAIVYKSFTNLDEQLYFCFSDINNYAPSFGLRRLRARSISRSRTGSDYTFPR